MVITRSHLNTNMSDSGRHIRPTFSNRLRQLSSTFVNKAQRTLTKSEGLVRSLGDLTHAQEREPNNLLIKEKSPSLRDEAFLNRLVQRRDASEAIDRGINRMNEFLEKENPPSRDRSKRSRCEVPEPKNTRQESDDTPQGSFHDDLKPFHNIAEQQNGGTTGLENPNLLDRRVSFRGSRQSAYKAAYLEAVKPVGSCKQKSKGITYDSFDDRFNQQCRSDAGLRYNASRQTVPPVGFERQKTAKTKAPQDSYIKTYI